MWVGNAWSCRKRLQHFHSFLRNGIKISVHNFVYVLTEEDRHIAYVEDMYEDKKMRKKLRVRWFHKTNELPCKIPPPAPLARELFFTSFPQVLSVECVDGLATVLSPEHFEKCLSLLPAEAAPQLHVCSRQLDNSDRLKPFSIHEVKGYWHQQILSSVGLGLSPVGPDKLGVRIVGRTTVRPFPTPCTSADYCIGQAVDVWWNDGSWEGIVVSKEPEGNVKVYFPGEGDISSFHSADLRVSKDWVNGSWVDVHCNYEALNAASLSSLAKNCEHPAAVEKKPYAVFPSSTSPLSPTTASLQCDAPSTSASEVDKKFLQYGRNGEKPSVKSKGGKELLSSDHSDERRIRPGNEDVEHLLHFVANCIDTEGELKEEASSAAPQETGCELFPRKSSMPQEAPISDVSPNLDSVSILSNTRGSLVSSDLRWNSARKRMRHGGESLAVLRAEHRVNQFQANNLNPAKEEEDMQAGDGSMSDRENEGLTSPCDQEEPRWRTGERSGESDDTVKLKKLRHGHEGTLKPIHAPPVGGTPLFLGTAPIANLVMSR
ncbi:hypothetical protein BDL97_10G076900 [Sphagnum fallax]|nr:hypothetical protein BDL97_10G076900 [Sphagnum fallax]